MILQKIEIYGCSQVAQTERWRLKTQKKWNEDKAMLTQIMREKKLVGKTGCSEIVPYLCLTSTQPTCICQPSKLERKDCRDKRKWYRVSYLIPNTWKILLISTRAKQILSQTDHIQRSNQAVHDLRSFRPEWTIL